MLHWINLCFFIIKKKKKKYRVYVQPADVIDVNCEI